MKEIARGLKSGGWFSIVVPKESVPRKEYGHNSCWGDRNDIKSFCEEHLPLISQTVRSKVSRKTHGDWEIQLIGQVR